MDTRPGWVVTTVAEAWLEQASAMATNELQWRLAQIIGNGGIIVAGLREIGSEIGQLLGPLRYLNPQEWPEQMRQEWAMRIFSLANEDVILPRMRAANSILMALEAQEEDPEITQLIRRFRSADPDDEHFSAISLDSVGSLLSQAGDRSFRPHHSQISAPNDYRMHEVVGALLGLNLADLDRASQIGMFIGGVNSRDNFSLMLAASECTFGLLIDYQRSVFPHFPAPTWAWGA